MSKKMMIWCMLGMLIVSLSGCQLAKEDGMSQVEEDRLVGVLITKEYLDLFDIDRYLNDNISSFVDGKTTYVNEDSRYSGRIYAELKPRMLTHEESGETVEIWEYEFEEIDGITFFTAKMDSPDGISSFHTFSDNAIGDGHYTIGNDSIIEGTIYRVPANYDAIYVNPVYQSSDGRVYVMSGSGYSSSGIDDEGACFTSTLEEKHTIVEDGVEHEESFTVKVNIATKNPIVNVAIIQMQDNHSVVSQEQYRPEQLPEEIVIHSDTEYVLVETMSHSSKGDVVKREIYESGDNSFGSYLLREDGIFEVKWVSFAWD